MSLLFAILVAATLVFSMATDALTQTCPSGMVSYWRFDEGTGTTATDSVGTNDGTLISSPTWTTGEVDGALDFNGSNNYVTVGDSSTLDVTQGITLEAWIYPADVQATRVQDVISKHASPGGIDDAYWLQVHPSQIIRFGLSDGLGDLNSSGYKWLNSSHSLENNTWYHVVGTWDGFTMKIYINGVQDTNIDYFPGPILISPLPVAIGRNGGDGWSEFFDGVIDEAAIYNRALTPEEVQQHYQNGLLGLGYCEVPSADLASLAPAPLWIGLKNSDDQGTQFDLRTEVYINEILVSDGISRCITGVTRNPSKAKEVDVPFGPITNGALEAGDILSLKVLTRIGTNQDDTKCSGHNNAVGLRLYYDAVSRPSRFGAEITPDPLTDFFLHSDGTDFLDDVAPTATTAKFKDSSSLNFSGGNPWHEIGTWSMTLP